MGLNVLQEASKGIAEEKTNRQPGGIGGKTQNVEIHIGIQQGFIKQHLMAFAQLPHHFSHILFLVGLVEQAAVKVGIGLLPVPGPEDHGGVPHGKALMRQQVIQCCGVSKGGIPAGGGVSPLRFYTSIGFICGIVERNQRVSRGFPIDDSFYRRMKPSDRFFFAGYQTDHLRPISQLAVIPVPGGSNGRVLMDISLCTAKDQVSTGQDLFPLLRQSRMLQSLFRLPGSEERRYGPGGRGVNITQQRMV